MTAIPLPYRLFFLYLEPLSTLVGAYYAWFQPHTYLSLTHAASAPSPTVNPSVFSFFTSTSSALVPIGTHVVLRQLANLYFAFTLNEALVLRATDDLRVWRTLLFGLLVADFGHLYSCALLGWDYFYDVANWNSIAWGNIGFVYAGATLRTCFLLGVGLEGVKQVGKKVKAKGEKAKARVRKSSQGLIQGVEELKDEVAPKVEETPKKTPAKRGRKPKAV